MFQRLVLTVVSLKLYETLIPLKNLSDIHNLTFTANTLLSGQSVLCASQRSFYLSAPLKN